MVVGARRTQNAIWRGTWRDFGLRAAPVLEVAIFPDTPLPECGACDASSTFLDRKD